MRHEKYNRSEYNEAMKRKRRNYSAEFKSNVGVAEQTDISNTKPRFGWKTANLKNGQEEFGACAPSSAPTVAWQ